MHKSSFIEGFYKTTVLALAAGKDIIISMEKYGVKQVNRHPRHKVHSDLNGTTLHTKSNASSQLAFSLRTHLCVCCPHISAVNKHPIRIHWPPGRDKSLDPPPSHTRELHNHEVMVTQTPEELLLHASRWLGEASKGPPPSPHNSRKPAVAARVVVAAARECHRDSSTWPSLREHRTTLATC